jgi:hypothetical protein
MMWHSEPLPWLQVAGMVAIFQAQKCSMQADIDQHREIRSTLHVRFLSMFPVQLFVTAGPENHHFTMCAVQLLDVTGASLWHWTRSTGSSRASVAAAQAHRSSSSWNAVVAAGSPLHLVVPESHSTLHPELHLERFRRLLTASQVQGLLAEACSDLPFYDEDPATVRLALARNWMAAEAQFAAQHKLSRWPWSMIGIEVSVHKIPSHIYDPGHPIV